tara:strand:+ start:240 stop:458 length:219 start_codon:yes stop_codon:yes gene_type:complete
MSNIEYDQKIRSKNLELTRALQDVDRLTTENINLQQSIKELRQYITELRTISVSPEEGFIIDTNGNKVTVVE